MLLTTLSVRLFNFNQHKQLRNNSVWFGCQQWPNEHWHHHWTLRQPFNKRYSANSIPLPYLAHGADNPGQPVYAFHQYP